MAWGWSVEQDRDRNDWDRVGAVDEAEALRLILALAEALREEFGVGIDAHPGGRGTEAGIVNRAFRAATRRILQTIATPLNDVPLALSRTLRLTAWRNLAEMGLSDELAERLLDSEPGLGDRWCAWLALAPSSVVNELTIAG